jgi:anti-sigma regulatory factor (Ser/Thr protein kinase)
MGKKQTLTLAGRYEHVQQLCQFVADGARQSGLDDTAVFHVELACDEACTNIIEHAYAGEGRGDITIKWQVSDDEFVITIEDNGRSFNPESVPTPVTVTDVPLSDEELANTMKIGGLGVHFIRKLMDDVQFSSGKDGNRLVLMKKLEVE